MANSSSSQGLDPDNGIRAAVLGGPVPAPSSSAPPSTRSTANFAGVDLSLFFQHHIGDSRRGLADLDGDPRHLHPPDPDLQPSDLDPDLDRHAPLHHRESHQQQQRELRRDPADLDGLDLHLFIKKLGCCSVDDDFTDIPPNEGKIVIHVTSLLPTIEALPLLRDVAASERQVLFLRKLQICSLLFDFSDKALASEQDPSARRNAFLMLFNCAQDCGVSSSALRSGHGSPLLCKLPYSQLAETPPKAMDRRRQHHQRRRHHPQQDGVPPNRRQDPRRIPTPPLPRLPLRPPLRRRSAQPRQALHRAPFNPKRIGSSNGMSEISPSPLLAPPATSARTSSAATSLTSNRAYPFFIAVNDPFITTDADSSKAGEKPKKARRPRSVAACHHPYVEMISEVINSLKEWTGAKFMEDSSDNLSLTKCLIKFSSCTHAAYRPSPSSTRLSTPPSVSPINHCYSACCPENNWISSDAYGSVFDDKLQHQVMHVHYLPNCPSESLSSFDEFYQVSSLQIANDLIPLSEVMLVACLDSSDEFRHDSVITTGDGIISRSLADLLKLSYSNLDSSDEFRHDSVITTGDGIISRSLADLLKLSYSNNVVRNLFWFQSCFVEFPSFLFECRSLMVLKFAVDMRNDALNALISLCPEIETLALNGCSRELTRVASLSPTMRSLTVNTCEGLDRFEVYLTSCCALGASAVGAYLHILMNVGGFLTFLGVNGGIVWLMATPPHDERKRFGILMGTALLEGATVGPLIEHVIEFDPIILISAFGGTALAFGCFSAAAVVAKRGEFLYLEGLLSYGLSILMWLRFASSIFGSTAIFSFELYFGLMIFLGYVVFDTQSIIERAHHGDLDYVKHALVLFVDFIGILVRILIIMLKNAEKSEEKEKKRRRS